MARSTVAIRIGGPDVDPERITALLGCAPDLGYPRGAMLPKRREHTRIGLWLIRADARAPADLDAQFATLIARTTDDLTAWAQAGQGHRVDAFCGLFMDEWNEGISIAPATLLALGQRGIALGLDVHGHALAAHEGVHN